MDDKEFDGHVKDVVKALKRQGIEANEEEISRNLGRMIEQAGEGYKMVANSKTLIVKGYKGDASYLWRPEDRLVGEVTLDDRYVNVMGKILSWNEATSQDGRKRHFGTLMDDTGSISFVVFKGMETPFVRGDGVDIENAQVREGRDGKPQLILGDRSAMELDRLNRLGDLELPSQEAFSGTISEVDRELPAVTVRGRVIDVSDKDIRVRGEEKTVSVGVISDGTGSINFTDWEHRPFTIGSVVTITDAYTRVFMGRVDLNISERSRIETEEDDGEIPALEELKEVTSVAPSLQKLSVSDLNGTSRGFSLEVQVMDRREKTIETRNGEKEIVSGVLADSTGTISFTSWGEFEHEEGAKIRIVDAYVKEFNNRLDVNLGDRTVIEVLGDDAVDPVDYEKEFVERNLTKLTVSELSPTYQNVDISGRLLTLGDRELPGGRKLREATLADDTGKVQVSIWTDADIEVKRCYRIAHAYVRSFRGVPQLQIGDRATVELLPEDSFGTAAFLSESRLVEIADIPSEGGAMDVKLHGIVLEVRQGSGLVDRCPDCQRVLRNGACMVHRTVEGTRDLRTKAILDDGTGAVNLILNRKLTEKVLETTMEECERLASEKMSREPIEKMISDTMVAALWEVSGDVNSDDYGFQMIARDVDRVHMPVRDKAREFLQSLSDSGGMN